MFNGAYENRIPLINATIYNVQHTVVLNTADEDV